MRIRWSKARLSESLRLGPFKVGVSAQARDGGKARVFAGLRTPGTRRGWTGISAPLERDERDN
jgi:hypothetical protein